MKISDVIERLEEEKQKNGDIIVCVFDSVLTGYTTDLSFEKVYDDMYLDEEEKVQIGDFIIL